MGLLTGRHIGGYEFLSVIGTGGFSTVYLVADENGDEFAAKVLAENHAFDADIRERFISEADALRRVRSDLIIEVFDLGETDEGQPFIVMQHADRGDLVQRRRTLIDRGWKPVAVDVQFLTDVIADAVESVHVKNLVHRDVSPSNILIYSGKRNLYRDGIPFLRGDESLVLADFGLVKDMSEGSGLTVGAGTPGFSAPEQRTGLALIDHRIDIYAASAVVLWFLTGATVPTMPDWRDRLADDDLPVSLLDAIGRGLSPLPEDRHATIDEWHEDITNNLSYLDHSENDQIEIESPSITGRRPRESFDQSRPSILESLASRPKTLALAGLVVLFLLVGVASLGLLNDAFNSPSEVVADGNGEQALDESTPTSQPDLPASTSVTTLTEGTSASPAADPVDSAPAGEATEVLAAPPTVEAYFDILDDQQIVQVSWSNEDAPANATGRDIEAAINEERFLPVWRTETVEDFGLNIKTIGLDESPISRENDYHIRVRWVFDGGGTSGWSPIQTVADP